MSNTEIKEKTVAPKKGAVKKESSIEAPKEVTLVEGEVIEGELTSKKEEIDNLSYYNEWKSPPLNVLKSFNNGTYSGTDIKPQWRVKVLTEAFGPCGLGWYFEVINKWLEEYGTEVKVFVEINLFIKDPKTNEWSKPIFGTGGNFIVNYKGRVSDEGYKMATTDAISYACQQLGIAGDIYMGYEKTKYIDSGADTEPACEAARYKGKAEKAPASKPVKSGPVNKFGMDIGELFGKNRKYYIDLISVHFSNPVFRAELKEYVRAKGKKTHSELEDMHLQDFFMSIESAVSK